MVFFTKFDDVDDHCLALVDKENDNPRSGTYFIVKKSLCRPNIADNSVWEKCFPTILHKETSEFSRRYILKTVIPTCTSQRFPLLGREIISGSTRWVSPRPKMFGEFYFIPGYWEWVENILARFGNKLRGTSLYDGIYASLYSYDKEDSILRAFLEGWCHSTNTLHTLAGEMSISLWDIHRLGGLPIFGEIYDETIPSLDTLQSCDHQGKRIIPRACDFLFIAYHHLSKANRKRGVTAQRWIEFWCGVQKIYDAPARKRRSPNFCPQKTYNSNGKLKDPPTSWTDHEESTFRLLGITGEERKSLTHLAAFLSCWLCVFVLPQFEHRLIRPQTFVIATKMARGIEFSLALSVLGSIYHGLNEISISDKPANTRCFFPTHFLYGWLAYYFSTHHRPPTVPPRTLMVTYSGAHGAKYFTDINARKLIHEGYSANVGCTISSRNKQELLIDDEKLSLPRLEYLISLRSGYLVLRKGSSFYVEPYLPSRFSRQFGFCQDVEGVLPRSIIQREVKYHEALKYWKIFLFIGSHSQVLAPPYLFRWEDLVTSQFRDWWKKNNVKDLIDGVRILEASIDPPKPRKPIEGGAKDSVVPCKRNLAVNEADENPSDTESDVNFKHKGKKTTVHHSFNIDKIFDGVPSSDTPINPHIV